MTRAIGDGKAASDAKLRYDLLPPDGIAEMARVFTVGAAKHGDRNWETSAFESRRYVAAIHRHLAQWQTGEDVDPEDGCHHLAKVAVQAIMIVAQQRRGRARDGRLKIARLAFDRGDQA